MDRARTRTLRLSVAALTATLALAGAPDAARADVESWVGADLHLYLNERSGPQPPIWLRLWTEARLNGRSRGLQLSFLRLGGGVDVLPWLTVAAHGVVVRDYAPGAIVTQEARAELEPTFVFRTPTVVLTNRNRLELRVRGETVNVRYRNMLRINPIPQDRVWAPFVWDEVLAEPATLGFQNRLIGGMSYSLGGGSRIDLGHGLRTRREPTGWHHDYVVVAYIVSSLPL